ncbi:glycosyltransferase family 32 protein [Shewanella indica]|uniref:glycosyltransferase family 32 protein n=1 Tax=Shewanella indica TaxID=768528 RepID=UPI00399A183F
MNIPKVIHYVWMGKSDKPISVIKCIDSWKKKLPDYEIIEWNEKNFNVDENTYCKEAYENKKWAFVSDYVRLAVLLKYGGIYLDTDVIVKKNFDDLLSLDLFLGKMYKTVIGTAVIGSKKDNQDIRCLLDNYNNGLYDCEIANNYHFTKYFQDKYTFDVKKGKIEFDNSVILDRFSFENPSFFYSNGYSVHLFDGSWIAKTEKPLAYKCLTRLFRKVGLFFYLERFIRTNR